MQDERYNIHWNNKDIVQKVLFNGFPKGVKPLLPLGIDTPEVQSVENTDIVAVKTIDDAADCLFRLTDNSLLHIEFQSTYVKEDIRRFCEYDSYLYNKHKDVEKIRTVVIYTNKINPENVGVSFDAGSLKYSFESVFLRNFRGDYIYEKIKGKIEENNDVLLTEQEELALIYNPLMNNKDSINDRVIQISDLMKKIYDDRTRFRVLGTILAFHAKEINESVLDKLWEVLSVGAVFEKFQKEVVEKAKKEERFEIIRALIDSEVELNENFIKRLKITPEELKEIKENH